mgnify:CR=1 FL=1
MELKITNLMDHVYDDSVELAAKNDNNNMINHTRIFYLKENQYV